MSAKYSALTVHDPRNMWCDIKAGSGINLWMHCGGRGISGLCDTGSKEYCSFVRFSEDVQNKKYLSTFERPFDGKHYPNFICCFSSILGHVSPCISPSA